MYPDEQSSFGKKVKKDLVAYLSETTVHGFQYVVNARYLVERVAWVIFIGLGFFCSGYIFMDAFQYWDDHPVETTIDKIGLPVHQLPFPAITVCDTASLKMPRKNRWMFVETLLNSLELSDPEEELKNMYPCNTY